MTRERIEWLSTRQPIRWILDQEGISQKDYLELFTSLRGSALGDLAGDIVSTPHDLSNLIRMKREGKTIRQIWSHFRYGA